MTVGADGHETAVVGLAGGPFRVGSLRASRARIGLGRAAVGGLPAARCHRRARAGGRRAGGRDCSGPRVRARDRRRRRSASARRTSRSRLRGAGNATRQINHIITPDFAADRLEVVEVYTPSGNWSSWPPHKHDTDDMPNEAVLEEIYHYRFRRSEAWGVQRLYGGSVEGLWTVRDGESVIVARRVPPVRRHPRRRRVLPQCPGR